MSDTEISFPEVEELLARWWFTYDRGDTDAFAGMFTADAIFTVGLDDPTVEWAEFATAEVSGRDEVVGWQTEHRLDSPAPLRHHLSNVHRTGSVDGGVGFASYILVTHVIDQMPSFIPSGVVTGVLRREDGDLRIARMDLLLDTLTSVPLRERS